MQSSETRKRLRQDVSDDVAVDIGEPEVAALVAVGEALVLNSHEVEESRMEVVHMHRFLDDIVAIVVGFSVADAGLRATTGEPHRETTWMVIAAVVLLGEDALAVGGAAEFPAPDDKCVIKHSEALEVLDERGLRLVGVFALHADFGRQVSMLIPTAMIELHEADAALGEAAGHEAVVGVGAGNLHIRAIHVEGLGGFLREVGELWHSGLHAVGHLVLGNARQHLRVKAAARLHVVEVGQLIEHASTVRAVDAVRVREKENRFGSSAEVDALMFTGQKAGTPQAGGDKLRVALALADHDNKGGQVFIHASEPVADPGTEGGTTGKLESALKEGNTWLVVDLLGEDRLHNAEFFGDAGRVGVEFGNPKPVLVILVFFELEKRWRDRQAGLARGHAGDALVAAHGFGQFLVELIHEPRFVVENVHLRWPAVLEEVDDPLGFRREVRGAKEAALEWARSGREHIAVKNRAESHGADALRHFSKKLTPADIQEVFFDGVVHRFCWVGKSIAGNGFIEIQKGRHTEREGGELRHGKVLVSRCLAIGEEFLSVAEVGGETL